MLEPGCLAFLFGFQVAGSVFDPFPNAMHLCLPFCGVLAGLNLVYLVSYGYVLHKATAVCNGQSGFKGQGLGEQIAVGLRAWVFLGCR